MKFSPYTFTGADVGKLFFVKHEDGPHKAIRIKEVRRGRGEDAGRLYLCGENDIYGWCVTSYGMPCSMLTHLDTVAGPIVLPDELQEIKSKLA